MNITAKCPGCGDVFPLPATLTEWQAIFENGEKCRCTDIVCPVCGTTETVQADNAETLKLLRRQVEYLTRRTKKSDKKARKIEIILQHTRSRLLERVKNLSFAEDVKEPQKFVIFSATANNKSGKNSLSERED